MIYSIIEQTLTPQQQQSVENGCNWAGVDNALVTDAKDGKILICDYETEEPLFLIDKNGNREPVNNEQ